MAKLAEYDYKCTFCHPPCPNPKCAANECYFGVGDNVCGCYKFDHECDCHKAPWVDRRLECPTCAPMMVKYKLKWVGRTDQRKLVQKGIRLRLKGFKGTLAERYALIEKLEDEYDVKYRAACLSWEERDIVTKVRSYSGTVIQQTMWRHFAPAKIQNKFKSFGAFLEYTEQFTQYGEPKAEVPFD